MDVPVFATKQDLDLIKVMKLAKCFRKNQLSDADAEQLAGDLEALNRLKASGLISAGESLRCEKRIYKRYQAYMIMPVSHFGMKVIDTRTSRIGVIYLNYLKSNEHLLQPIHG